MNAMSKDIKKPIVLIGLMGAGKTTVGTALSKELGLNFFDADNVLEKEAGRTIPQIFEAEGEPYFRDLERKTIRDLVRRPQRVVISVGGGAFMDSATRRLIQDKAISIYLDASSEELKRRVGSGEGRPLLDGVDIGHKLRILKEERDPIYRGADYIIVTKSESVDETVRRVIKAIQK